MPIRHEIDNECVITTGSGVVSFAEVYEMANKQKNDPDFRSPLNEYQGFTQVDAFDRSTEELETLTKISPFGTGSRRAFLVTKSLTFGLAKMYDVFQDPSGAEICTF